MEPIEIAVVLIVVVAASAVAFRSFSQAQDLRRKYAGLDNLVAAEAAARERAAQLSAATTAAQAQEQQRRAQLEHDYQAAVARYNQLRYEVALLEENMEDISFGLYKPHFNFQTSDEYRANLEGLRERERQMIHQGDATFCPTTWTVGNSQREGERMVKQNSKLLLRAFNGECDAALANVTWKNAGQMEQRVERAYNAINQLGGVVHVSITQPYFNLKLNELRLAHEFEQKRYEEKERLRKEAEVLRDQERAAKEIEKARQEAEEDEEKFRKALERARAEAATATGAQMAKLKEQVAKLDTALREAMEKKARAISRAQLTRSGFVYVISNVGSFGERVYKIGMTRRLDPQDRVDELGDASVPFPFDVHAMLYSEDAPALETALHQQFGPHQVNLVNARKEFFGGLELSQIEAFLKSRGMSAQFVTEPEARQYRETLMIRRQAAPPSGATGQQQPAPDPFSKSRN